MIWSQSTQSKYVARLCQLLSQNDENKAIFLLWGATGLRCRSHTKKMQMYLEGAVRNGDKERERARGPMPAEWGWSQCENMWGGGWPRGPEDSENTFHKLVLEGLAMVIALPASGWSECNDLVTLNFRKVSFHYRIFTEIPTLARGLSREGSLNACFENSAS